MDGERSHTSFSPARRTTHIVAPGTLRERAAINASPAAEVTPALQRAAGEHAAALDPAVRAPLEQRTGHDFSRVRVFQGPASALAAEQLGARAFTLGNSIYLGNEALGLDSKDRTRLLTHEAVHTVQQGGVTAAPQPGLAVSNPQDAAEVEARQIAETLETQPDATGDYSRGAMAHGHRVAPHFQRDLTKPRETPDGKFEPDLKIESHPGKKSGLKGTIKFTASPKAPDSDHIRLLQIARVQDVASGREHMWTGAEANREKAKTTASAGVDPGYFVDVVYGKRSPRTKATDASVSPYYIEDYKQDPGAEAIYYDGSKKGNTVAPASLGDFAGSDKNYRFSLETVAKDADHGHIYGSFTWGFTISDPANGTVDHEHAESHPVASRTFDTALGQFDKFFRNPGASTAPK